MFWRGFGVLCVLGANLITFGAGSLSSAGNGTKKSSVDSKQVSGDHGRNLKFGIEVEAEELARTFKGVDVGEVLMTKGREKWSSSAWATLMVETEEEVRTTQAWISNTVTLVSTCVRISPSKEEGRTSQDASSSSSLHSISRNWSNICGWIETTGPFTISRTISATGTIGTEGALVGSAQIADSWSTRDGLPISAPATTSRRRLSTDEGTRCSTVTSVKMKTMSTMADHTTAFTNNQGSTRSPFKASAYSTRYDPSAVIRMASAESHGAPTSSNSSTVLDLEESVQKEHYEGKEPVTQPGPERTINAAVPFLVDEKAALRSNSTTAADSMPEALRIQASANLSSPSKIVVFDIKQRVNSTSVESSLDEEEGLTWHIGATGTESYSAESSTPLELSATLSAEDKSESLSLPSDNSSSADIYSEAGSSNLTGAMVSEVVVGTDIFSGVLKTSPSQNVTADLAPSLLNITLLETVELSAENAAPLASSSMLSTAKDTSNEEIRNTTSISSKSPESSTTLVNAALADTSPATISLLAHPDANGATKLEELANSSSFMPVSHSADISSILAGTSDPSALNNTGTGALVVFALPSNQSTVLDVSLNNDTSREILDATNTEMRSSTAPHDSATGINITIVGDQSIPLNDTKLRQYDTLYKIDETTMKVGWKNDSLGEENTIDFVAKSVENLTMMLNGSPNNQSGNIPIPHDMVLVGLTEGNDTAIVEGTQTAPFVDKIFNMSLAYQLESAIIVVVVDNATSGIADTPRFAGSAPVNNTEAFSPSLTQSIKGSVVNGNSMNSDSHKPTNGSAAQINLSASNASSVNGTVPTSFGNTGNLITVTDLDAAHVTNGKGSNRNVSFISTSPDLNEEVVEGTLSLLDENKIVLSSNGSSLSAIEAGLLDNLATISNFSELNNRTFINIGAINYTDLADAQVRRYISGLTNALHMSRDNLKDLVCTDESLMSVREGLSGDKLGLAEQACLKLWEKHSGFEANETAGIFPYIGERMSAENSSDDAAASVELKKYASLAKFTEADGNAPERLGPPRTSAVALPAESLSINLSSGIQTAIDTTVQTPSYTISTLSTSFTSVSTSNNLKTTSTSSSMRPKMTACADDFGFFDMTDANLDESGTIAWYMNWTAISAAEDGKFNSLGEVRYFGQQWLKDPDYDCGLEHGGCTRRPSCNNILSLYPDDAELARRIYFVMKMHSTINTVMKSYYDAIQLTHQNVAAQIHTIVSTTMQTPHFDDAAACKFLQTSYSNIQTIIIDLYEPRTTMEGKGWNDPWFVDDLKYTTPSAQGIWWLQYPDPITHKEKGMTRWVHGRLMMLYRMWFRESIGRMDASLKLCDGLGIVNQDKAGTEEKLKLALSKFSTYQRKELSKHVKELNQGKFYEDGDPSVLSSMLTMGIWNNEEKPQSALNLLSDPYQLEEMMTNQSKEGILSQSYIQQKCYMKCVTHPHALLICEGFNDWEFSSKHALKHGATPADPNYYKQTGPMSKLSEAEKNMRICPEPNKVCQVECWSQEKKGWSMPLHGINQLGNEPLGVDIQQKMKDIYAYYKENGNVSPYDQPQDPAKDMDANLSDLPKPQPPPKGPHFWLPVCDSDQGYTHIVDFGQQRHNKYNLKQYSRGLDQRSFPVSCGSFRSDQTVEFMEAMGLTNHHAREVSWTMDPFFQNYAALNLAVLIEAPLDNFLAFCALGIAYPQNDLMDSKHGEMGISRQGSRWCEPIAQETEGMGWYMANLWFCRKSSHARQLFKNQGMSGAIVGLHKIKNHRALCRRWLAQAQGEAMGGLDEIDGSQSKNRKVGPGAIGLSHEFDSFRDRIGKGGKHGHAPVTEDGKSKGWFDVMNREKGNRKRHDDAEYGENEGYSFRVVRQAERAAQRKDEQVLEHVRVEIDMKEAMREEEAYWKAFAALTDDEDDEIESS